jgi:hypothetical protein
MGKEPGSNLGAFHSRAARPTGKRPPALPEPEIDCRRLDSLPAPFSSSSSSNTYVAAPGDIYPRGAREEELCAKASHPDWAYLIGLGLLDVGAVWLGSSDPIKFSGRYPSLAGPAMIGLTWGATVGGAWLALPKCSPNWVGEPPPEGEVRATWPLALSLALLAGATAPIVNGIAIGSFNLPGDWTTFDRELHVVVASVAGFGGALLPYLFPPRTWRAAREIEHIRLGAGQSSVFLSYVALF